MKYAFIILAAVALASCQKAEITFTANPQQIKPGETTVITIEANKADEILTWVGIDADSSFKVPIYNGVGSFQYTLTSPGQYIVQGVDLDRPNSTIVPVTVFVQP